MLKEYNVMKEQITKPSKINMFDIIKGILIIGKELIKANYERF